MSSPAISITRAAARRFLVRAFALDGFQTLPNVVDAIDRLEFVQEDSINICGRAHDLMLWGRVNEYSPQALHAVLYERPVQAFEYFFPVLCVLPIRDYPYFLRAMRARAETPGRWHGLLPDEIPIAEKLLALIDTNGPLRTRTIGSEDGHTTSGWGTRTTIAARVVEKMWVHGRLSVARRENFERWFDRTERMLPEVGSLSVPDVAEQDAYLRRKRKRARRLFRLQKGDVDTLGADAFVRVDIEGVRRAYYALAEDVPALSEAETETDAVPSIHLLSPLDPLIYDRDRNQDIFDFEYTWEVYTPVAKRRWGYYVLPILRGDRLIGRVDPKIDRRTGTLTLQSLTLEPGVTVRDVARDLTQRLVEYARFLGATRIDLATEVPAGLRRPLTKGF